MEVGSEVTKNPLGDILDIDGALSKVGVGDSPHALEDGLHHRVKTIFGILQTILDRFFHLGAEAGIVEHHPMRFKDEPFIAAGKLVHAVLEFGELPASDFKGGLQARLLVGNNRRGNLVNIGGREAAT